MEKDYKLELKSSFNKFALELKEIIGNSKVFYMPNIGNLGDGLIFNATLQFFKDFDIDFEIIDPENKKHYFKKHIVDLINFNSILIYGGGGGWCRFWSYPKQLLIDFKLRFFFKRIIILPSTYEFFIDKEKFIYYSRDKFTSILNNPKSKFYPDLALYLLAFDKCKHIVKSKSVGYFFRTDVESKRKFQIPVNNFDISITDDYEGNVDWFIEEIGLYEEIHTDRLHVAIAGLIGNCKVHLYAGGYFKNFDVYRSSLVGFNNITFYKL